MMNFSVRGTSSWITGTRPHQRLALLPPRRRAKRGSGAALLGRSRWLLASLASANKRDGPVMTEIERPWHFTLDFKPAQADSPSNAASCHPLPRFRSRRLFGRTVCGPLVRARLYRGDLGRLVAGTADRPEPETMGRPLAHHSAKCRRRDYLVRAWHRAGRPARLCAVLREIVFLRAPAGDFSALARRNVVPRRLSGNDPRAAPLRAQQENPDALHTRSRRDRDPDRPLPGPHREFHQRRIMGPRHRRTVGDHLPARRPRSAPPEPAL